MFAELGKYNIQWPFLVSLISLGVACFFDFKTKKVPNKFVLISLSATIVTSLLINGLSNGMLNVVFGLIAALVLTLPLTLAKVIGAGDMKIFAAVTCLFPFHSILDAFLLSFIWGGLLGLFSLILKGKAFELAVNMRLLLSKSTRSQVQTHQIPFTVGLFLGVLSEYTLSMRGLSLL